MRPSDTSLSTEIHKEKKTAWSIKTPPFVKCNKIGEKLMFGLNWWLWNIIWRQLLTRQFCLQDAYGIKPAMNCNCLNKCQLLPKLCSTANYCHYFSHFSKATRLAAALWSFPAAYLTTEQKWGLTGTRNEVRWHLKQLSWLCSYCAHCSATARPRGRRSYYLSFGRLSAKQAQCRTSISRSCCTTRISAPVETYGLLSKKKNNLFFPTYCNPESCLKAIDHPQYN